MPRNDIIKTVAAAALLGVTACSGSMNAGDGGSASKAAAVTGI